MRTVRKARLACALLLAVLLLAVLLAGCKQATETAPPPPPAEVTDEATGYYCGMLLIDHDGPKGQIHLASREDPLWFSSVRDTIAFLRLPEEASDVTAVYVNDMGRATNWEQPQAGTWVDAHAAWFVVDSTMRGGMGAPEAVSFAEQAAAEAFRARHGGQVVRLDAIADDYVLGPVELGMSMPGAPGAADAGDGTPGDGTLTERSPVDHAPAPHHHPADADGHPHH